MFYDSVPVYIRDAKTKKCPLKMELLDKLKMIAKAVGTELGMYDYLKNLKKDLNKKKRLLQKQKNSSNPEGANSDQ